MTTASMNAILGDPDRLKAVAEDFVKHYGNRINEGSTITGKAMFVCSSRFIAYDLYKQIIERTISDKISSISMPLLGVHHDCVSLEESLDILVDTLNSQSGESIFCLSLNLPEKDVHRVTRLLDDIENNK